jgi:serine-type D-Ala-D-Ala carboxypeptidase (penicillin-binding protein 5/6)
MNFIIYKINFTRIFTLASLFLLLFVLFVIINNREKPSDVVMEDNIIEIQQNPFDGIVLEAKAAFVWDVKRQEVLYSLNEEAQLPLASLTKLMTAFTAAELLPKLTIVTIDETALAEEGDSGLYANEKWDLRDLLGFTLTVSSNDGASAIAGVASLFENNYAEQSDRNKEVFVSAMNRLAREIGLTQTYFVNETGLDKNESIGGAYGSARDIAILLEHILLKTPDITEATRYSTLEFLSLSDITHSATNTNESIHNIPGLIASKTGFTDLSGGNLAIAFDRSINHPIIISVLGSTPDGRFRDVEKLVWTSFESLD